MPDPTPMPIPPELAPLAAAVPGLVPALRHARLAGESGSLDERTLELVRIATLVALGAPRASFVAHVARARHAGASPAEIWDAVAAVATIVGVPRLLAATPYIAAALEEEG